MSTSAMDLEMDEAAKALADPRHTPTISDCTRR